MGRTKSMVVRELLPTAPDGRAASCCCSGAAAGLASELLLLQRGHERVDELLLPELEAAEPRLGGGHRCTSMLTSWMEPTATTK